jgi:hypothetical protein
MKMKSIAKRSKKFQSFSLKSTSNARTWKRVIFANALLSSVLFTSAFQSYQGRPLGTTQASMKNHVFGPKMAVPLDTTLDTNVLQRIQEYEYKTSALHLSSLGQDPEEAKTKKLVAWFTSKLPPPPEDQISLAGDVGCLFLYSFLDHFVNKLYDKWMNSPNTIDLLSPSAAIESSSAASSEYSSNLMVAESVSSSLPVWFDPNNSAPFGTIPLSSALPLEHHITYAPAIETAGMASVMICSAWMVSGYFTGAFQFKNTLECSPSRAMLVTAKTWVLCSLIMLALAWSSDSLVGSVDSLHKSVGITKADADYIFDSLSVLLMWRFILSSFFGGNDDGDADKIA